MIVEADPLTNGEVDGRDDEALDGAVSMLGMDAAFGIDNCVKFGYAVDVGFAADITGFGFIGDIHKDGGRDK